MRLRRMRLLSGYGPLAVAAAVTSQDEKHSLKLAHPSDRSRFRGQFPEEFPGPAFVGRGSDRGLGVDVLGRTRLEVLGRLLRDRPLVPDRDQVGGVVDPLAVQRRAVGRNVFCSARARAPVTSEVTTPETIAAILGSGRPAASA
jgi:hypothetical protein